MNKRQKLELAFRQHTKEVLGENAVKEFAGSELEALCVTFIQKQGQALPLVDVSQQRELLITFLMKVGDCYGMEKRENAEICVDEILSN